MVNSKPNSLHKSIFQKFSLHVLWGRVVVQPISCINKRRQDNFNSDRKISNIKITTVNQNIIGCVTSAFMPITHLKIILET